MKRGTGVQLTMFFLGVICLMVAAYYYAKSDTDSSAVVDSRISSRILSIEEVVKAQNSVNKDILDRLSVIEADRLQSKSDRPQPIPQVPRHLILETRKPIQVEIIEKVINNISKTPLLDRAGLKGKRK